MARLPAGMTRRKDGIIMCRFTINGERYYVYGSTISDVREKEQKKRQEIEEGLYKSGENISLDDYFSRWIEAKQGTVKETTLRANRIDVRYHEQNSNRQGRNTLRYTEGQGY